MLMLLLLRTVDRSPMQSHLLLILPQNLSRTILGSQRQSAPGGVVTSSMRPSRYATCWRTHPLTRTVMPAGMGKVCGSNTAKEPSNDTAASLRMRATC